MPARGKEFQQLRAELRRQHFLIQKDAGEHYKVYKFVTENGEHKKVYICRLPGTSVSKRTFLNRIATLRRKGGFKWKGR